jgi:uncharacterized protein (TIGR03663 family)
MKIESGQRGIVVALLIVVALAAALRLTGIEERPFHHDEAINSIKLELLWQRGDYKYRPDLFHGPTLPYLSLPFVWASPAERYSETRELTYRALPFAFGMALVVLTFGLAAGVGRTAAIAAASLCAASPSMVFYSRYYIHEMPLVGFGLIGIVCGWRALRRLEGGRSAWGWVLGLGAALGLMHATKETFVINLAAAGLGIVASVSWRWPTKEVRWHALAALLAAACVSILFFSSFFSNAQGPIDSLSTFTSYLELGGDVESVHHHEWYWYLKLLFHQDRGGVLFRSEAAIGLLALVGVGAAIRGWGLNSASIPLARFFAVYTIAMLVVYSAIPYKTPWCILGVLQGMIVLAGVGIAALFSAAKSLPSRVAFAVLLLAVAGQLAQQNWLVNAHYASDERNPWVYAHSLSDVRRAAKMVRRLSQLSEDPRPASTYVFNWLDNAGLYFYLRGVPNIRFRPAHEIARAPASLDMILINESDSGALNDEAYGAYHIERFQLRPNIWARLYVRPKLWDAAGESAAIERSSESKSARRTWLPLNRAV